MRAMSAVMRGNALALPLRDRSVDLIVTSPPYFGLRSYQDGGEHYQGQIGDEATPAEFVDALIAATREAARVLKPSGSLWVNLGDAYFSGKGAPGRTTVDAKNAGRTARRLGGNALDGKSFGVKRKSLVGIPWRYALRCIDDLGLILRAEEIWSKPNPLPESVTDRPRRSHETWFHFTKSPRYFANIDAIREPHLGGGHPGLETRHERSGGVLAPTRSNVPSNPRGKVPGSVRSVPSQPLKIPDWVGVEHYAAFPMEWPRWIIAGWCPEGGTVLDPFGGTGTTALMARTMGRTGISLDMSADYCRAAVWRTTDPKERAKARRKVEEAKRPTP